jgi:plastocyanin
MNRGGLRATIAAFAFAFALGALAAPAHAATIELVMQNLVISPAEVTAKVGDTVTWTNKDVFAHTATANNGDFDVTLPPHGSGSFVLKKAGDVSYYCRFHPNMKATIKVEP